jgi:hypothetical protein
MSLDGTYGFVYSSSIGVGIGVIRIDAGIVVGSDIGAGRYRGTAVENPDGTIDLQLEFTVAPGFGTVQGTEPQELPYTRPVKHTLPPLFGDGEPARLFLPPAEVIVMVKRVPDDFAPAAVEGFTWALVQRMSPMSR